MYLVHARFGTRGIGAVVSALGLVTAATLGHQQLAFAIFGAYLVIFFGERSNVLSRFARRAGDMSYGVYLFGWPIEQLVQVWTGADRGEVLFAYSLLPTLAVAAISWWAVERPCLRLKGYARARRRLPSPGEALAAAGDRPASLLAPDEAASLVRPTAVGVTPR
jgi:peptidoglycan/LPS O-acetylase OafA/YrhL